MKLPIISYTYRTRFESIKSKDILNQFHGMLATSYGIYYDKILISIFNFQVIILYPPPPIYTSAWSYDHLPDPLPPPCDNLATPHPTLADHILF